jgi:hypothetical protein
MGRLVELEEEALKAQKERLQAERKKGRGATLQTQNRKRRPYHTLGTLYSST